MHLPYVPYTNSWAHFFNVTCANSPKWCRAFLIRLLVIRMWFGKVLLINVFDVFHINAEHLSRSCVEGTARRKSRIKGKAIQGNDVTEVPENSIVKNRSSAIVPA